MNITPVHITVGELAEGFEDRATGGVTAYAGELDVRPEYQREFVYEPKERDAVLRTVMRGLPLNVMYWVDRGAGEHPRYEVMDGQQRTISLCGYVNGDFTVDERGFANLESDEQQRILDYELMVYVCDGTDSEKLDWFQTINVAGKPLMKQELRNAVYHGPFVARAKEYFSRTGGPADAQLKGYLAGAQNRQEWLETVLLWGALHEGLPSIEAYLAAHQRSRADADRLWSYVRQVFDWVEARFTNRTSARMKLMRGLDWGPLFDAHGMDDYDSDTDEARISAFILDDEVTNKKGIYRYVITGDERTLSLRAFTEAQKHALYERDGGICPICGEHFELSQMEADHITPWSQGGKTELDNGQMLCRDCNRRKSDK